MEASGLASDNAAENQLGVLKSKLKQAAHGLQPSIYRRQTREAELLLTLGIRVLDWADLKRPPASNITMGSPQMGTCFQPRMPQDYLASHPAGMGGAGASRFHACPLPKVAKAVKKAKAPASGRVYTSRFRGVHQTFPTKRWEAQFRRNGKPTSLGCFDQEEEAAKSYDKMMLWSEIHNGPGVKGGITNFESAEYEDDLPWLKECTQDALIEFLRSEGRRQAVHRTLKNTSKHKREHAHGTTDEDGPSGSAATMDM